MASHAGIAGAGDQTGVTSSAVSTRFESETDPQRDGVNGGGGESGNDDVDDGPSPSVPRTQEEALSQNDSSSHSNQLPAVSSPPYWQNIRSHRQTASSHSSDSELHAGAITLLDNEADNRDEHRNNACWARSVEIIDYTIVNGGTTNFGAFVVWNVRVQTLHGSYMEIRKRYSEFDKLRDRLVKSFPNFDAAVPSLPPKSVISRFRPKFLEKRRAGLQYFLNCVILNPEFSGSPVMKDFIFS